MAMIVKYQVGQEVWRATFEAFTAYVTCPDCGGDKSIRVLLHDDTMVAIECEGCRRGYDPPTGLIPVYDRKPAASLEIITGVEVRDGKVEWQTSGTYRAAEEDLFDNEVDCLVRAKAIAAEYDREDRDRVNQKEKPTKSWSWHVHYHRRCLRDAQKQIEWHTAKLAAARTKAKEPAAIAAADD